MQRLKKFTSLAVLALFYINPEPVCCLQCKFKLGLYTYDLCPLIFQSSGSSVVLNSRRIYVAKDSSTPPTVTQHAYGIDLGGEGLPRDATLPMTEQCPEGTWICLRISNTRPNHPSEPRRILQIIPVAGNAVDQIHDEMPLDLASALSPRSLNATARLVERRTGEQGRVPALEITLNGGLYLSRPQRAVFSLLCDTSVPEPSTPAIGNLPRDFCSSLSVVHDSEDIFATDLDASQPATHGFTWRTRHACPIAQEAEPPQPTQTRPEKRPQEGEEGEEKNTFPDVPLSDDSETHAVRRAIIGGMAIGCMVALALLLYVTYVLRTRRRSFRGKGPYIPLPDGHHSSSQTPFLQFISVPLPSLPFSLHSLFRARPSSRRGSRFRSTYDPLSAEEYEIQEEDQDGSVVDFQRQGLLEGHRTGQTDQSGYGSVR